MGRVGLLGFLLYLSFVMISIIMLQKSSARKGFCAEGLRIWKVKWYIQHAGSAVFTRLPAWVIFFEKSFFARRLCRRYRRFPAGYVNFRMSLLFVHSEEGDSTKRKHVLIFVCHLVVVLLPHSDKLITINQFYILFTGNSFLCLFLFFPFARL